MLHKIRLYLIKHGFILSNFRKNQIPYQKFTKSTQKGRYMLFGLVLGLLPYVVHMSGVLR